MIDQQHFRKLEKMYLAAACNKYYQPKIHVTKGKAEINIPIREDFFHAAGAIHGSTYFKALDDAAFFSANSLVEKVFVLTSNFTIHFLAPVSKGHIKAIGNVLNTTHSQLIAESILYDSVDKVIARGLGSFVKSTIELRSEIGYA